MARTEEHAMLRNACALALALLAVLPAMAEEPAGKLIATGWDAPTPARWRKELPAFARRGVFQGAVLMPTRRVGGADVPAAYAFTADVWAWDDFAAAVADLRAARSATVTETFLLVGANPGNVDWFDDGGWRQIVE